MTDRWSTLPKRALVTPWVGKGDTPAEIAAIEAANIEAMKKGEPFYARVDMADEPYEDYEGTEWLKKNVLTDETEIAIWGDAADRTPNDAFKVLGQYKAPLNNILINPLSLYKIINQRALTVYSVVNQYTIDRWKLISGTLTVNVGSGSVGIPESVTLNGVIRQIIEFPQSYAGKTVTASVVGGTVSINGGAFAEKVTVTLPSPLTSLYMDIKGENSKPSQAQLIFGETVQPFNPRPITEELALCKRYFHQLKPRALGDRILMGVYTAPANGIEFLISAPVPMRVFPKLEVKLLSGSIFHTGGNSILKADTIALFPSCIGNSLMVIRAQPETGSWTFGQVAMFHFHGNLDVIDQMGLFFDAEL